MESSNIIKNIENIEKNIFDYNINNIMENMISQIDLIYNLVNNHSVKNINILNNVLKYITIALENKDHLLLADLLEYELKPILIIFDKE